MVQSLKKIVDARIMQGHILLMWEDGSQQNCPNQWLRDNCPSIRPGGPDTQRQAGLQDIPPDISPESVGMDMEGNLIVTWKNGGHRSIYPPWYPGQLLENQSLAASVRPVYWGQGSFPALKRFFWESLRSSAIFQKQFLEAVVRDGFALIHQLPPLEDYLFRVVELFGHVRETNYGRSFHVREQPDPDNLAYTTLALSPHTDNPYRDPVPGLQLLHCIEGGGSRGETVLVDGHGVAEELRQQHLELFDILCNTLVEFSYKARNVFLHARKPVIETDLEQKIRTVRFNNRSVCPFRLKPEIMDSYYKAYYKFAEKISDKENQIRYIMQPGDLIIFDNERILHGRTSFVKTDKRWLQGCYSEKDGMFSRLECLLKDQLIRDRCRY